MASARAAIALHAADYSDDVDLNAKLAEWESFYNLSRPHGAFDGKAPYEILPETIISN